MGLRNRIIHGYWSIDIDIVYTTAERQLPEFVADLRRILAMVEVGGGEDAGPAGDKRS